MSHQKSLRIYLYTGSVVILALNSFQFLVFILSRSESVVEISKSVRVTVDESVFHQHRALYPPSGFLERCSGEWDVTVKKFKHTDDGNKSCCSAHHHFVYATPSWVTGANESLSMFDYYFDAPFGNALVKYYNDRALAYLDNHTFFGERSRVKNGRRVQLKGMLACFPSLASPSQSPYRHNLEVIRSQVDQLEKEFRPRSYPHMFKDAAYNLIPRLISDEVQSIAQAWGEIPALKQDVPGKNTVVVHLRCNQYILNLHNDYGVLPHRFYLDRITPEIKEMVIVRQDESGENACVWSLHDLLEHASRIPGLRVTIRSSPDPTSDWLYLSKAPILVCSASTFCLTAAWGNPNSVFFPSGGRKSAVVYPDRVIRDIAENANMTQPNFHWVSMDFLPGKTAAQMEKSAVLSYVRSDSCDKALYGCVADPYHLHNDESWITQQFNSGAIRSRVNSCSPVQRLTRLELLHITKTGGSSLEVLAARHNVSWGACHFLDRVNGMPPDLRCPNPHLRQKDFSSGLPGIPLWHAPPRFLSEQRRRYLSNATLFTVVRDPYSRLVNSWNYNSGSNPNATAMNEWVRKMLEDIYIGRPRMNGTDWRPGYFQTGILIPQTDYIDATVEVLHLETLSDDFSCLMRRYGLDWRLEDKARNPSRPGGLTDANLSVTNLALINLVYHKDFVELGYPKRQ